jgi:TM2 domain-containing membrane protein YozV
MKSKTTAYLLWFFLGWLSAHRFYLGKIGSGLLYLFTGQLFFIGWILDAFLLSGMVDRYNAIYGRGVGNVNTNTNTNMNNIVVNVGDSGQSKSPDMHEQLQKLAELKEKGLLSEKEFDAQKAKLLS